MGQNLRLLSGAALAALGLLGSPTAPLAGPYAYELEASLSLKHGVVAEAAWFDSDSLLTLELSPDGAQVAKTAVSSPAREIFLSREFISAHICPAPDSTRLSMQLSPARRHIVLRWKDADGLPGWALLDVSAAPEMRLRRIPLPGGMSVGAALFSPDDRYLVLAQDSTQEGSAVALLALDLRKGEEVWRVPAQKLGFVRNLWWASTTLGSQEFNLTASLFDGQFQDSPGLVRADLPAQTLSFTSDTGGLLCGAEAIWGSAEGHRSTGGNAPFFIRPAIPGQIGLTDIPLSREPLRVALLAQPGLALVSNSGGDNENELWLVDLFNGSKLQVDGDCEGFDTLSSGRLLVRARRENVLRIYTLARVENAADAAPGTPKSGRSASGSPGGGRK